MSDAYLCDSCKKFHEGEPCLYLVISIGPPYREALLTAMQQSSRRRSLCVTCADLVADILDTPKSKPPEPQPEPPAIETVEATAEVITNPEDSN